MRLFCRKVRALFSFTVTRRCERRAARFSSSLPLFDFSMSDEDDDYSDSGSDEEVDPLVEGYRGMETMFEDTEFHNYDPDFDAYDANDANLDVAVLAWQAACSLADLTDRSSDARAAAMEIAETTMIGRIFIYATHATQQQAPALRLMAASLWCPLRFQVESFRQQ